MDNFSSEVLRLGNLQFLTFVLMAVVIVLNTVYVFVKKREQRPDCSMYMSVFVSMVMLGTMFINYFVYVLSLDLVGKSSQNLSTTSSVYTVLSVVVPLVWIASVVNLLVRRKKFSK